VAALWRDRPLITAAVVAVIVTLVFLPATTFDFLAWDDPFYVTSNPLVRDGLTPAGVREAMTAVVVANWAPLTILSYQLDATLFGVNPWGFHLTNILVHAAGVGLLFLSLRRMTGQAGRSLSAALLFGIHPLRVESVAWIAERKDVLSFFFLACSLLAYEWYTRRPGLWRYCAVAVAMFASLASKATLVTLPILLVLLDIWPLRRISSPWLNALHDDSRIAEPRPSNSWAWLLTEKIPLVLIAIAVTLVTVKAQGEALSANAERAFWAERVPNAVYATAWYAAMAVMPWNLCPYHDPVDMARDLPFIAAATVAVVAMVAGSLFVARLEPAVPWGIGWFFVSLLPLLQLVQTGGHGYADRYTYIPHIGLAVAIVWGVADVVRRLRGPWWMGIAVPAFTMIVLVPLTERQLAAWRNDETLWTLASVRCPENSYIQGQVGSTFYRKGDLASAERHLLRGLELQHGSGTIAARLAVVYFEMGNLEKSRRCLDQALMTQNLRPLNPEPSTVWILDRLTTLQASRQPTPESLSRLRQGLADARAGHLAEALSLFTAAADADPRSPEAYNNAGLACLQLGRLDEARDWFDKAIDNDPWNPDFRVNMAKLMLMLRDFVPAIMHADIATKLSTSDTEAVRIRNAAIKALGHVPRGGPASLRP